MNVIEFANVVKRYQSDEEVVAALDHVDFRADRGEVVAIVDPPGSGKSTMLNMIGLFDMPIEGTVHLDGRSMTDFSEDKLTEERRSGIGFVFQGLHLLPMLAATENIELPSVWDTSVDRHDRAQDLLQQVGFGGRLDHTPGQLSGGQRQRVAIARALINKPDIPLADEPTGSLDQDTNETILTKLTRLKEDENVVIIVITHDEQTLEYTDGAVRLVDSVVTEVFGR